MIWEWPRDVGIMAVPWVTVTTTEARCFVILPLEFDAVFPNLFKLKHS